MSNYIITIFLESDDTGETYKVLRLNTTYPKEYDLKSDVIQIGKNGYLDKNGDKYTYYPPSKIKKIEVEPGQLT